MLSDLELPPPSQQPTRPAAMSNGGSAEDEWDTRYQRRQDHPSQPPLQEQHRRRSRSSDRQAPPSPPKQTPLSPSHNPVAAPVDSAALLGSILTNQLVPEVFVAPPSRQPPSPQRARTPEGLRQLHSLQTGAMAQAHHGYGGLVDLSRRAAHFQTLLGHPNSSIRLGALLTINALWRLMAETAAKYDGSLVASQKTWQPQDTRQQAGNGGASEDESKRPALAALRAYAVQQLIPALQSVLDTPPGTTRLVASASTYKQTDPSGEAKNENENGNGGGGGGRSGSVDDADSAVSGARVHRLALAMISSLAGQVPAVMAAGGAGGSSAARAGALDRLLRRRQPPPAPFAALRVWGAPPRPRRLARVRRAARREPRRGGHSRVHDSFRSAPRPPAAWSGTVGAGGVERVERTERSGRCRGRRGCEQW